MCLSAKLLARYTEYRLCVCSKSGSRSSKSSCTSTTKGTPTAGVAASFVVCIVMSLLELQLIIEATNFL